MEIISSVTEHVSEIRNLGVVMDENMFWKSHATIWSNKMSKYTGILNTLKQSAILCNENTVVQKWGQPHI